MEKFIASIPLSSIDRLTIVVTNCRKTLAQVKAETGAEITAALTAGATEPDAILRTGGETRLSNFLLWQSAYAELFFSRTLFPDLEAAELDRALEEYNRRSRNFGR